MHVCHFCDTTFEGEFFRIMTMGLVGRGVRVSLVELNSGSPPTWLADAPGVTYRRLGATSKLHYPMAVWRLARLLKKDGVDILHTHLFFAGIIGVLTKRLQRRTAVALMRHHTSVVRLLGWNVHIWGDKWMAEQADHVMTVSEETRRYMFETDGILRDEIDVVHIGFDFDKVAPNPDARARVRREFGFADDDFVIGYVATLVPGKGHLQLIEAFRNIVAQIPNARLFFVGGGTFVEVQRAAAEFPNGRIIFAGWRDDVTACLNAMDIFIQPSLSEAFSRVLVEAMGIRLPVIATRVGGAEEVIENGENGILIDPDDPDAIYRETLRLYRDRAVRDTIAEKGMISVRESFTAEKMVARLMELYQSWMPTGGGKNG